MYFFDIFFQMSISVIINILFEQPFLIFCISELWYNISPLYEGQYLLLSIGGNSYFVDFGYINNFVHVKHMH